MWTGKVALIGSAAFAAAMMSPELDRSPPSFVLKSELLTERVAPGEHLKIKVQIARQRICSAYTNAKIIDSDGNIYVYPQGVVERSQRNIYIVDRVVPSARLVPGPAVYQPDTSYACTWLQTRIPIFRLGRNDERIRFEIVEPRAGQ